MLIKRHKLKEPVEAEKAIVLIGANDKAPKIDA